MNAPETDQAPDARVSGWSHAAVSALVAMARDGRAADVISLKLQRPLPEITAKARELGLTLKTAL